MDLENIKGPFNAATARKIIKDVAFTERQESCLSFAIHQGKRGNLLFAKDMDTSTRSEHFLTETSFSKFRFLIFKDALVFAKTVHSRKGKRSRIQVHKTGSEPESVALRAVEKTSRLSSSHSSASWIQLEEPRHKLSDSRKGSMAETETDSLEELSKSSHEYMSQSQSVGESLNESLNESRNRSVKTFSEGEEEGDDARSRFSARERKKKRDRRMNQAAIKKKKHFRFKAKVCFDRSVFTKVEGEGTHGVAIYTGDMRRVPKHFDGHLSRDLERYTEAKQIILWFRDLVERNQLLGALEQAVEANRKAGHRLTGALFLRPQVAEDELDRIAESRVKEGVGLSVFQVRFLKPLPGVTNTLGFQISSEPEIGTFVGRVRHGGMAEAAGIWEGDVLTKVNEHDVRGWSWHNVVDLMKTRPLDVTFRRGVDAITLGEKREEVAEVEGSTLPTPRKSIAQDPNEPYEIMFLGGAAQLALSSNDRCVKASIRSLDKMIAILKSSAKMFGKIDDLKSQVEEEYGEVDCDAMEAGRVCGHEQKDGMCAAKLFSASDIETLFGSALEGMCAEVQRFHEQVERWDLAADLKTTQDVLTLLNQFTNAMADHAELYGQFLPAFGEHLEGADKRFKELKLKVDQSPLRDNFVGIYLVFALDQLRSYKVCLEGLDRHFEKRLNSFRGEDDEIGGSLDVQAQVSEERLSEIEMIKDAKDGIVRAVAVINRAHTDLEKRLKAKKSWFHGRRLFRFWHRRHTV